MYGMTSDEYWNGNPYLCVAYRKKHKLDIERRNQELWLEGNYIYNAIMIAISNIHLDGKHHKINPYLEKPFDLFPKTEEQKKDEKEIARQKVIDTFAAFKKAWDKKKG